MHCKKLNPEYFDLKISHEKKYNASTFRSQWLKIKSKKLIFMSKLNLLNFLEEILLKKIKFARKFE
jgi:hypothetical protein